MAIIHCSDRPNRLVGSVIASIPKARPKTANTENCIAVSSAMARKRLPIPAIANSRDVCSGVSMVSLSA